MQTDRDRDRVVMVLLERDRRLVCQLRRSKLRRGRTMAPNTGQGRKGWTRIGWHYLVYRLLLPRHQSSALLRIPPWGVGGTRGKVGGDRGAGGGSSALRARQRLLGVGVLWMS